MSRSISLAQKFAGTAAFAALAFAMIAPLTSGTNRIAANQKLLSERRAAVTMLEDRIAANRASLQTNERLYRRSQLSLDAQTVSDQLNATCAALAERLNETQIQQNCAQGVTPLGGGLQQHAVILTASGSPPILLQALDSGIASASLSQFRIDVDPDRPDIATLSLAYSEVSQLPEETPQ